jgi:plasmid maintenance system antidote protein VapI
MRRSEPMKTKKIPPHPSRGNSSGRILEPLEISQYRMAKDLHVSARRINEIIHAKQASLRIRLLSYLVISTFQSGFGLIFKPDMILR